MSRQTQEDIRICWDYAAKADLASYIEAADSLRHMADPSLNSRLRICGPRWERTDGRTGPLGKYTAGNPILFVMEYEECSAGEAVFRIVKALAQPEILLHLRELPGIAGRLQDLKKGSETDSRIKQEQAARDQVASRETEAAGCVPSALFLPPRMYGDPRNLIRKLQKSYGIDPRIGGSQVLTCGVYETEDGALIFPGFDMSGRLVWACRYIDGRAQEIPGSHPSGCWLARPQTDARKIAVFPDPVTALQYLSALLKKDEGAARSLQCAALVPMAENRLRDLQIMFPDLEEILPASEQIQKSWCQNLNVTRLETV